MSSAVLAYKEEHGHFPPPYIPDADGNPMHSWRVLILPYLDEQDLFEQYRFDEPWNGPRNSQLASRMPEAYQCLECDFTNYLTPYLAVTGAETIWQPDGQLAAEDIADGNEDTILLSEYHQRPVHWMAPTDLSYATVIADSMTPRSQHDDHDYVIAYADGYVEVIHSLPVSLFHDMLTVNGGEVIDDSLIDTR